MRITCRTGTTTTTVDLPALPARPSLEQRLEWKDAVAALPGSVQLPSLPKDGLDGSPEANAYAAAVQVMYQQQMNRQAELEAPMRATRDRGLARTEIASIDRRIGALQARRAELMARIVLADDAEAGE